MHVTHVVCDLNQQRSRAEARRGSLVLAIRRSRRAARTGRTPRLDADALKPLQEDVGHALDF
jgi:hypothetical protein